MNPCRCGYYPDRKRYRCSLSELRQYMQKISRPLLDRIDISVEGISFVTVNEKEYPMMLLDVFNPPFIIFYRGTLPKEDEECVAMVGARRCSPYGKKAALDLSSLLAKKTYPGCERACPRDRRFLS